MTQRASILLVVLGAGLLAVAPPAQPAKDEGRGLVIKQTVAPNQMPELHVKADRSSRSATPEVGDEVLIAFEYGMNVKAGFALAPGSKISMRLDNMSAEVPLHSSKRDRDERLTGLVTLRRPAKALNKIKAEALRTCQRLRSTQENAAKEHRVPMEFPVSATATIINAEPGSTTVVATATTVARVVVVCHVVQWEKKLRSKYPGGSSLKSRPRADMDGLL